MLSVEERKTKVWKLVQQYVEERKLELMADNMGRHGDDDTARLRGAYWELDRMIAEMTPAMVEINEPDNDFYIGEYEDD